MEFLLRAARETRGTKKLLHYLILALRCLLYTSDTETPQAGTSPGPEEPPAGPALEQGSLFDS